MMPPALFSQISDAAFSRYASVFGLMFMFPSETIMPAVGFAAANGEVSIILALSAGVAGSALSSLLVYFVFRQVRIVTTGRFIVRHGSLFGMSPKRVKRAEDWFDRHGHKAVFASRFAPAVRTAVCVPAGLAHMPFGTFISYVLTGTIIDSVLLLYIGYSAGDNYETIINIMTEFVAWSWVLMIMLVLLLFVQHTMNKSK